MQKHRPVMLVVLDGWGWREEIADNAVRQAKTPTFDALWAKSPHAFLDTSGKDVGLPRGQMGNSEVGHLNIGAGRVVMQDLPRVSDTVESGGLAQIPQLNAFIETLRQSGGACHLLGLVSPGGVHSHQDHAAALAAYVAAAGVRTYLHAFTDGRDTPPRSSDEDLKRLLAALPPSVTVATVCGRYYAMDRDNRWERVSRAYDLLVSAHAPRFPDPLANPYLGFSAMMMAGLDGIQNKIHPGDAMDKDLYALPPEELKHVPTVCGSLREALEALDADREFLKKGDVFPDDLIDGYIALKWNEVYAVEHTPHPVEYAMYYSS